MEPLTRVDLMEAWEKSYSQVPHTLSFFFGSLLAFNAIVAIIYWIRWRRTGRASVSGISRALASNNIVRVPTAKVDFYNWLIKHLLWTPVVGGVLAIIPSIASYELLVAAFGPRTPLVGNIAAVVCIQFVIIYLSQEFHAYVSHYAQHKVPLFWSLHRAHHSAEAPNPFAGGRGHPADEFVALLFSPLNALSGVLFYALGTELSPQATSAFAAYFTIGGVWALFHHSNVRISFGWFDRIVSSPVMHQIHHSAELRHRDKNIGSTLSIFDWMFGTLYTPSPDEQFRWGLNDEELGENNPHNTLGGFYLEPLRHAWATLRRPFARLRWSAR